MTILAWFFLNSGSFQTPSFANIPQPSFQIWTAEKTNTIFYSMFKAVQIKLDYQRLQERATYKRLKRKLERGQESKRNLFQGVEVTLNGNQVPIVSVWSKVVVHLVAMPSIGCFKHYAMSLDRYQQLGRSKFTWLRSYSQNDYPFLWVIYDPMAVEGLTKMAGFEGCCKAELEVLL